MTESPQHPEFERLIQTIDPRSRVLRAWELKGGSSAQVTALEVERPFGAPKKLIVRRHGEADLRRNPQIAADEFKLLKLLKAAGLPTPTPYFLDRSGEFLSTPCLVVEYIEGELDLAPANVRDFVTQLATTLAKIHSVDRSAAEVSALPAQELRNPPANVAESVDYAQLRQALELASALPRRNEPALLHGDFWPGNTLWREGRLVGVIDWEDAARGDPLADVANARLEILWAFGPDAMNRFTREYESMLTAVDFTNLPYWDLWADVRLGSRVEAWGLDDATKKAMRDREEVFVSQALGML